MIEDDKDSRLEGDDSAGEITPFDVEPMSQLADLLDDHTVSRNWEQDSAES